MSIEITSQKQTEIKAAVTKIQANAAKKQEFYDYYKGKHQLNFASEKFKNKFGLRLQKLKENLCKTVVKAPAARLELVNFLSDKRNTENPAWKIWKRNKMPLHSGKVHREAFKTGEAFVLVWEVNKKAKFFVQNSANCAIWKNAETEETEKAAKLWQGSDKKYYLNLYYNDRTEKYISDAETPENFSVREIEGEIFPLPHQLGRVPMFHFVYDEETDGENNSILTDVIPINDTLNKTWADLMGAQEENMRRRRYVSGMQVEVDEETGKKLNPFKNDDDVWFADEDAKFGEFTDANLTEMIAVKQEAVKDIALVSGIPPSYFNIDSVGTAISGEALRKIEARFTSIVQDAQRSFGETWAEIINCGLDIENLQESLEIEPQWADASPVSETELLDNALKKKNLGWSIEQLQRDLGLTDKQIEKMLEENNEREQAKIDVQMKAFDSGSSFTQ